ncbi:MAG: hypothetical protein HN952_02590 [Candidatus Cloacimonetes bacterium]|jgi:lysine 2,3-aminomutase|nr:hypothetical protein [Candidatus Cloacimonadota bacterium]MBT6993821.1 hypothetical protein [Candidatus Cloacimonadota bacterium]
MATIQNAREEKSDTKNSVKKIDIQVSDVKKMMDRYHYSDDIKSNIMKENLLPAGVLSRLHSCFTHHSDIMESSKFLFTGKEHYAGLSGFREIVEILHKSGINIGHIKARELFIQVYRFLATKHVLNTINWNNFTDDSLFQLVFPQLEMIQAETVNLYTEAKSDDERKTIIDEYMKMTNPHDGKQLLNKPWFKNEDGELEILDGCQHKYPQCILLFDKTTQSCFAFCTYCFRHAQVRGDEDMFIQREIKQVHNYLALHKEITDVLITGGDASKMSFERLEQYVLPLIENPNLMHIRTLRLGTRALTFSPEMILSNDYNNMLDLFKKLNNNGIQVVWMAHISTPKELLNISTIAAVRRLRAAGVVIKSQSPIMNHISLFTDENGKIDVERSAQNWIDLGNILAILSIGFHSMYCARPTGEHHYFTVPLADINRVFNKVYRSLPSINRPSRYITMTSSAGKVSLLGTVEVNGKTAFALKFNEARNMEWLDKVFLTKYDEKENTIANLKPFDTDKHFYEDDLKNKEDALQETLEKRLKK